MKTPLRISILWFVLRLAAGQAAEPVVIGRGPPHQGRETNAQFRLFPAGAVAEEELFRLIVAPDLADEPTVTVDLQTPDTPARNRLQISPRWIGKGKGKGS